VAGRGLERLNEEIKRRTRVVRIVPKPEACLRLVTALCVEQSEEWVSGRRYRDMGEQPAPLGREADIAASAVESSQGVCVTCRGKVTSRRGMYG
jgi:hypothetical protein